MQLNLTDQLLPLLNHGLHIHRQTEPEDEQLDRNLTQDNIRGCLSRYIDYLNDCGSGVNGNETTSRNWLFTFKPSSEILPYLQKCLVSRCR